MHCTLTLAILLVYLGANDLLKSAQLAFKVKDKKILNSIFVEMNELFQRRSQKRKINKEIRIK